MDNHHASRQVSKDIGSGPNASGTNSSSATDDNKNSLRAVFYALGANVSIAIAKCIAALFTGSGSMFAEALHSIADCGNQCLLLWGRRQAKEPPTVIHPLGFGRVTYFWSFMVALLLFSLGGIASIYEGIRKLSAHEELRSPFVAIVVLLLSAAAEGTSLRVALKQINQGRGSRSLWRWFRETRRSELIIVFGEDSAALVGIAIASASIVATIVTCNPLYDAIGSLGIGALLMVVALAIGAETKSLLIGESAAPEVRKAIRSFISSRPEIESIASLITLQYGEDIIVMIKAAIRPLDSAVSQIASIEACERDLKTTFPQIRAVNFQPCSTE